jgi:hypothetical protein
MSEYHIHYNLFEGCLIGHTLRARNIIDSRIRSWHGTEPIIGLKLLVLKDDLLRDIYPDGFPVEHPVPGVIPGPRIIGTLSHERHDQLNFTISIMPMEIAYVRRVHIDEFSGNRHRIAAFENFLEATVDGFKNSLMKSYLQLIAEKYHNTVK